MDSASREAALAAGRAKLAAFRAAASANNKRPRSAPLPFAPSPALPVREPSPPPLAPPPPPPPPPPAPVESLPVSFRSAPSPPLSSGPPLPSAGAPRGFEVDAPVLDSGHLLRQHIEDLTREKFELARGLAAAQQLSASLVRADCRPVGITPRRPWYWPSSNQPPLFPNCRRRRTTQLLPA